MFDDFMSFYVHVHRQYTKGCYKQAYEIATRERDRFPKYAALLYHFRAGAIACTGDTAQALALLDEAVAQGYWYPDAWWVWDDFKAMQDLPAFRQVRARSKILQAEAEANARPELLVLPPEKEPSPYPLLLALHGNNHNADQNTDHWRVAVDAGWLLGLPQSSQITGPNMYSWDDYDTSARELQAHFAALCEQQAIDDARIVLGGMSWGAETALRLALGGTMPVQGVILVCPGGPLIDSADEFVPLIEAATARDLRVVVIVGGQDMQHAPGGRQVFELLRTHGFACELHEYPAMGHRFPVDFDMRLPELLGTF